MDEKRMLKNYILVLMAILLIVSAVLAHNMMEIKKYRMIEEGDYITVQFCQDWCREESGLGSQGTIAVEINFT